RGERLADGALAVPARVDVRGVDQPDPGFDGLAQEGLVLRRRREPVRAEADASELLAGESERSWQGRRLGGHAPRVRKPGPLLESRRDGAGRAAESLGRPGADAR